MNQRDNRQVSDNALPQDPPPNVNPARARVDRSVPTGAVFSQPSDRSLGARIRALGAWLRRLPFFRTRRRAIVTALICVPLLFCMTYWLFGFVAFADTASLIKLQGIVQTRHEKDLLWNLGYLNELVWRRHHVRTGERSSARLLFFNASTIDLDENTEISVLQCTKRRGGNAVDVVIKTWVGKTIVRAVRFVDPSSTLRVDTPTASTVVRGARFTVAVAEDGTTQIDLEQGTAEVAVGGEIVALSMGERITLDVSGHYETEQISVPDAQPLLDKIANAWAEPEGAFLPELTETEVNQFLEAISQQSSFFLQDTQVWFLEDEIRIATTVITPTRFDLSAAISVAVVDGEIVPQIESMAAGILLPIPDVVLNLALEIVLDQTEDYLAEAYKYVEFTDVQVIDGSIVVVGRQRPNAPG